MLVVLLVSIYEMLALMIDPLESAKRNTDSTGVDLLCPPSAHI